MNQRYLVITLLCCSIQLVHAEYIMLNSLKFNDCTYKQRMILHNNSNINGAVKEADVCEFVEQDTLYIVSSVFSQDYNEFTHSVSDVPTLIRELMAVYPEEGDCDNCGYTLDVNGYTPTTLTLCTGLDTIQYTTTPAPSLYAAVIRDTLYGSSNIRCGVSIQSFLQKLSIDTLYYDCTKYGNIVLIPQEFVYSLYQEKEYIDFPYLCFQLQVTNGIVTQIDIRHFVHSGNRVINKFGQMYKLEFY